MLLFVAFALALSALPAGAQGETIKGTLEKIDNESSRARRGRHDRSCHGRE